MLNLLFRLFSFCLGFLYPAYSSFKAIESEGGKDDTQWLTYWVVYSVFLIGESLADHSVLWIPGYRILKCGFIFWLASPRFKVLYDQAIAQTFRAAEPVVDTIAAQLMKGDFTAVKKELAPAAEALKKFGAESFEKTMTMSAELAKKAKEASEGGAKKD